MIKHRAFEQLASQINLRAAQTELIHDPLLEQKGLALLIKRDDLLHPIISGNKWRKLKYPLRNAIEAGFGHVISMGGPWSNHLHALAWCCRELGLKCTGLIRGETPRQESPTLSDMRRWGMQLEFVSRQEFRSLRQYHDHDAPPGKQRNGFWIPEGGACTTALPGVSEILDEIPEGTDIIATACGTATTLAGITVALKPGQTALGFPVMKGGAYLNQEMKRLISGGQYNTNPDSYRLITAYHFGGFGKAHPELEAFQRSFTESTGIPLDPVYTARLFYGLYDLIRKDYFAPGLKILALHTGGLQGARQISGQD